MELVLIGLLGYAAPLIGVAWVRVFEKLIDGVGPKPPRSR